MIKSKYLYFQLFGVALVLFLLFYKRYPQATGAKQNWAGVVGQSTSYSCGASALAMIFISRGIKVPLAVIEKSVSRPSNGSTLLDLKNFSQKNGLPSTGWKLSFEELKKIKMPAIIGLNDSHFVVVDSIKVDSVYLRDPLRGKRVLYNKFFLKEWSGCALEFH